MKRFVFIVILATFCASFFAMRVEAQTASLVISSVHADLTVNQNATLRVREVIEGRFLEPSRGLLRSIPTMYAISGEEAYPLYGDPEIVTPVSIVSVRDGAGRAVPYVIEEGLYATTVRIGNPDRFVRGAYTYVITYDVQTPFLQSNDADTLVFPVAGGDWEAQVDAVSTRVFLPRGAEPLYGDVLTNQAPGPLALRLRFTPNIIDDVEPTIINRAAFQAQIDQLHHQRTVMTLISVLLVPILLIAGILVIRLLYRGGRLRGPIIAQSDLPKGFALLHIVALWQERLYRKNGLPILLDWAIRGLIRIEWNEKKGAYFVSKTAFSSALSEMEQKAFNLVIPNVMDSLKRIRGRFTVNLDRLERLTFNDLHKNGLLLHGYHRTKRFLTFMSLMFGLLFLATGFILSRELGTPAPFIAGFALFILLPMFTPRPLTKTAQGNELLAQIKGIEQFLATATSHDRVLNDEKSALEKLLPFAVLFEKREEWSVLVKKHLGDVRIVPAWLSTKGSSSADAKAFLAVLDDIA